MELPSDPMILLSYINTKLRDEFSSLDELCQTCSVDKSGIIDQLKAIDYEYDPELNRFF